MTEHRRAWLTLAQAYLRVPELEALLADFGTPEGIANQGRRRLLGAGLAENKAVAITEPDEPALDRALQWLDAPGHHLVTWVSIAG